MASSTLQLVLRHAGALAAPADATPDADLLRRFAATGDEPAFAELVRRHGPLVWAACRHLLPEPVDAEDAFQATFLALARSARSVRHPAAVGGWLHGVAVRAATKLRRAAARRRAREHRAATGEADRTVSERAWDALLAAVHEEVEALPGPLRTAFVLCDLEGVRQPDAAARLGWKPGTLTGRLTRARQRLLARLAGRGLAPAAAGGAVGVGVAAAAGAVPAELVGRVVAVCRPGWVVPPAMLELLREVTPMTLYGWARRVAAAAVVAGGVGVVLFPIARAQPPAGVGGGPPPGANVGPASVGQPPTPPGGNNRAVPGAAAGGAMSSAGVVRPAWEYKYVQQRRDAESFQRTVSDHGAAGWEYCDHLELSRPRGDEATDLLVFKRPTGGGWATGGAGMMGGSGFFPANPGAAPMGGPGGLPKGAPPGGGGAGGSGPGSPANPFRPGMGAGGGAGKGNLAGAGDETVVLRARYARAEDLVTTLRGVFTRDGVDLTADERTNSVIARGDARALDRVRVLLAELDTPAAETRPAPKR